jgi:hypothetical protein
MQTEGVASEEEIMPVFKILQSLGAVAAIAGFFLPWSTVNFGATVNKAIDTVQKVVPGGISNVKNLDKPEVAGQAAMNAALQAPALAKDVKEVMKIPTGSFSGLDIALTGKYLGLVFLVPVAGLVVLLVAWLTPRGTGRIGTIAASFAFAALLGSLILSVMGGMIKEFSATAGAMAGPQPTGTMDMLKELFKHMQWGFWVAAAGTFFMAFASPFAKKGGKHKRSTLAMDIR